MLPPRPQGRCPHQRPARGRPATAPTPPAGTLSQPAVRPSHTPGHTTPHHVRCRRGHEAGARADVQHVVARRQLQRLQHRRMHMRGADVEAVLGHAVAAQARRREPGVSRLEWG
eukprot:356577-Chlamydomonas_euryale.AAC.1